jgi:7-cyano-7-deazaguanine synthase
VRARIAAEFPAWAERLGEDHILEMRGFGAIAETAMTADRAFETTEKGLPSTFVPGRNLIFLTYAAALADRRGIQALVGGMCETDFSGYPDCRDDTIKAMQLALNLGMDGRFVIHTPLMWIDKAATFALGQELGGDAFLDVLVEDTHTCYLGDRSHRHDWGYGCGECPACRLRADGFARWKSAR